MEPPNVSKERRGQTRGLEDQIYQAIQTGVDFTKKYYESLDRRRHLISRLYMDSAVLVWNGNGASGKDEIQKFLSDLPACDHSIITLDSQRILDSAVSNKLALLIHVGGSVKYNDNKSKPFEQTFMITAEEDKWKIVSDCFRFTEPVPP